MTFGGRPVCGACEAERNARVLDEGRVRTLEDVSAEAARRTSHAAELVGTLAGTAMASTALGTYRLAKGAVGGTRAALRGDSGVTVQPAR